MKSFEERKQAVELFLTPNKLMTKPLREGSCHNRYVEGACTGYEFQINTLSYRGVWISTIEDIELVVDGVSVPKSHMLFFCNGISYSIDDMVTHTENFWGCLDAGIVRVYQVGGLKPGKHTFELTIKKRADFGHSYGEGIQGYETAIEFHEPSVIRDTCEYTIA